MVSKIFAAAILLAATAQANRTPYKVARMPTSSLFGISRREVEGYQPEQAACGEGNTCSEACGAGYEQCVSTDSNFHCFNPAEGETCCGTVDGASCDDKYYCTRDKNAETWCCPDDMDLEACAKSFDIDGGLSLPPTSSATSAAPTTTAAPEEETTSVESTTVAPETTTTASEAEETTSTSSVEESTYEMTSTISGPTNGTMTTSYSAPASVPTSQASEAVPPPETSSTDEAPLPIPSEAGAATNTVAILAMVGFIAALL